MAERIQPFSPAQFERRQASFQKEFEQGRRQYHSLGGEIEAVFVRPENPKSSVPVIVAPGWAETKDVLKATVEELYVAGRTVIAVDHPRLGGTVETQGNYPIEELRKALTIREIIVQEHIDNVDIIAHSEGAINGAIVAFIAPGRVRNIVLVNPAGLIGKDTMVKLAGRFAMKAIHNIVATIKDADALQRANKGFTVGSNYVLQNPARGVEEIREISQYEIGELLTGLSDKGIGIVIIHGGNDPGLPMDRMQKVVKSLRNPGGFVDGFLSVKGGHDDLYIHPDTHTKAAEEMLTALENKQKHHVPTIGSSTVDGPA